MADALGIYFLDVGQGDCTFIVPPTGTGDPILFDCADLYVAERFVADHGFDRLDAVVASHLDVDHIRGILPFLRNHFEAGRTLGTLLLAADRLPPELDDRKHLLALLNQAVAWDKAPPCPGFSLVGPVRDAAGPLTLSEQEGDWKVDLVLPHWGTQQEGLLRGSSNLTSAVLRVERAGTTVLVGADAPLASWERLEPALLPARVLRIPHHGGDIREATDAWTTFADLYDRVVATDAVISVGTNNVFSGVIHPLPDHVAAIRRGGACAVRCTQLTPRCHPNPRSRRDDALAIAGTVEPPYRHIAHVAHPHDRPTGEVPCAASMVVWLDADGHVEIEPSAGGAHDDFVARLSTPMCRG